MTALRTAQLEKVTFLVVFFFVQASVPSRLASAPPPLPPEQMYRPVWRTLTAYHPPAALCPCFFFILLRVSVPFYQVVGICRQTAAKLRMQAYHTCTLFYVSKLGYIRACKRIHAANKIRIFRHICHIENRAYGFLAGVWLQRAVSPNNLGKFGLTLIGDSDEANMSTSSNSVTIFMKSVRYHSLFRSLNSWVKIYFILQLLWRKTSQTYKKAVCSGYHCQHSCSLVTADN